MISRRDLLKTSVALLAGGLIGYVAGNYVPATYRESLASKEFKSV
ncbi:MAG: hypothetical protein ACP5GI_01320 [Sulfolobales archaeon]